MLKLQVILTAKIISWQSISHLCVSWLLTPVLITVFLSKATDCFSHVCTREQVLPLYHCQICNYLNSNSLPQCRFLKTVRRSLLKSSCEKKKMLVYPIIDKSKHLSSIDLVVCKCSQFDQIQKYCHLVKS